MRPQQRLRRRQDFAIAYQHGRAYARGPLALRVRTNPDVDTPRFGFAVGKRLGGAVIRNRIKRRLREAARLSGAQGKADVVVIARTRASQATYDELEQVLLNLLGTAGLLPDEALLDRAPLNEAKV